MSVPPARPRSSVWGAAIMRFLTCRSGFVVFAGFLVWFVAWSIAAEAVLEIAVPSDTQASVSLVAGPLVPALGVMFAFLTAFAINTEWGQLRAAQHAAELEADAAARFALVAESPGLDGPRLRRMLQEYLQQLIGREWPRLPTGAGSRSARDALAELFRETRQIVAAPTTAPVTGTDLLAAVDSLVSLRRDRLSSASQSMPPSLLLLAFASGVVLCLDTVLIALPHPVWLGLSIGGVVVITALALALVVAISAPYRGSISVDPQPIVGVLEEVRRGDLGAIGPP